ncbi:tail fiber assembly protein [Pseudomonas sp. MPB23]|uniref:tail fiber assembly protein n=1 Tax=Pseudomonas sp. MPB23 TaxID=3388490 RepID=UPI0039850181
MPAGHSVEYWPSGQPKYLSPVESEADVPEGWGFVKDGDPLPETVEAPPTAEQLLAAARTERDRLLAYATLRINPLQYAADLDEASDEDLALLKLWKKYSSAVNKTETKPGWPESPQWPDPPVPLE